MKRIDQDDFYNDKATKVILDQEVVALNHLHSHYLVEGNLGNYYNHHHHCHHRHHHLLVVDNCYN
uniref:Putative ovule protein n=1 Tax=Solanum chacoense TaxID=4108 RepID=A0A0V0GEP2_SOLCH